MVNLMICQSINSKKQNSLLDLQSRTKQSRSIHQFDNREIKLFSEISQALYDPTQRRKLKSEFGNDIVTDYFAFRFND